MTKFTQFNRDISRYSDIPTFNLLHLTTKFTQFNRDISKYSAIHKELSH